jgi:hypothetical protein
MNTFEDYIPDALDMVSAWEVPEQDFSEVVNQQAMLMAGLNLEPRHDTTEALPFASLLF